MINLQAIVQMKKLFNRILVPVHFNRDTPLVLLKAIQVANEFDCDIYLLHVQEPLAGLPVGSFSKSSGILSRSTAQAEARLEKLKTWCRGQLKDGLLI
ncbi:MAG TPA: universal stress protein, partial [Chitinophagaceae bacterium]|nr:universal stress protein [Chitinophagaceae bacterium]